MESLSVRARRNIGRMLNSAVSVINSSTMRRRSNFARSATTNSYGPVPIDGDSVLPLMYTSQRSNSTTSTNSIVSTPGGITNLIQVRSLDQSTENDLNVPVVPAPPIISTTTPTSSSSSSSEEKKPSLLNGFIKIAEYMYITDKKDWLNKEGFDTEISHVITIGDDCSSVVSVKKLNGLLVITPLTLFHDTHIDPHQPFASLSTKFDKVNLFIENARKICQKIVIYSKDKAAAYFVAAQYNIDYYQLEPGKAVHHLMKLAGEHWVEPSAKAMKRLRQWRELVKKRNEQSSNERKLSLSINSVR